MPSEMPEILVLDYSRGGSVARWRARARAESARSTGARACARAAGRRLPASRAAVPDDGAQYSTSAT